MCKQVPYDLDVGKKVTKEQSLSGDSDRDDLSSLVRDPFMFFLHTYVIQLNVVAMLSVARQCCLGPFKCYITQMGVGCVKFSGKKLRRCRVQRY